MVEIYDVTEGSDAAKAGIKRGDFLISINGHAISDILDYSFYITEKRVTLLIHRDADIFEVNIKKREYADIGLEFETFLMDEKHSCRNKCVFCFIDQNPPGMRDTVYFKDDDARLSFLQGAYVTLTNMSDADLDRIALMKTSPINISVHATDPALREQMLCNKNAGRLLSQMKKLADAGITMNCQVVLCKGLNDGAQLIRTMEELAAFYPCVASVAIVPAGLTRCREKLYPLELFSPEEAGAVIDTVEAMGRRCKNKLGSRLFYCADELYIRAGRELHAPEFYEDYPQLENGVGLITSMLAEFEDEIKHIGEYNLNKTRRVSVATGEAAYEFIDYLARTLCSHAPNLSCRVYKIENDFFGHSVTVAGLLTGQDIKAQLTGKRLGGTLFLPRCSLRAEGDLFLDGMKPSELEAALEVKVRFVENSGEAFIRALLEE